MPVNIKTNVIKYKDPETNQFIGISAAGMMTDNLNLTSSVESTSTASEQHTVGSYFLYNSNLYTATSTINPGETIAPGTNCERAYLSDIAAIKFDQTQNLTEEQKAQARANIQAAEDIDYAAPVVASTDGIIINDAQKNKAILIRTDLEGEVIDEPSNSVSPPKILSTAKSIKYVLYHKNLIGKTTSRTASQLTITYDASTGKCTLNGTPSSNVTISFNVGFTALPAGKYTLSAGNPTYKSGPILKATKIGGTSIAEVSLENSMAYKTFETIDKISGVSCYVPSGTVLNNFVIQPQIEVGELSDYSLPISKTFTTNFPNEALVVTGQEVQWVSYEENGMITEEQEIVDYKTCPGGFVSVDKSGNVTLTVTHAFIASYNGETLPDNFVGTDVREYTAPSYSRVAQTGSQVFYELPTEDWITYDLGHFDNSAYELNNVLLSSYSNTKLTYLADTKSYIDIQDSKKADLDYVDGIISEHNSYKLMDDFVPSSNTDSDVTFTWTGNTKCVVTGTPSPSSSTPLSNAFAIDNDFSHGLIKPGGTYYLHFKSTGSKVRVLLQFGSPSSGGSLPQVRDYVCTESTYFTIASNEFSVSAKLSIPADVGAVNETVEVGIYTYPPNKYLVRDVMVNGSSITSNGVANIPLGGADTFGMLGYKSNRGLSIEDNLLRIQYASTTDMKNGSDSFKPITSAYLAGASFYGLAKAAGDSTQSLSINAIGTYTDAAKTAIQTMLGVEQGVAFIESISGTTPSITGVANTRYKCGECATLAITPPATGTVEVQFASGSTATVLTITPPAGVTAVKWPAWFDATSLDVDTTYDIIITDGEFGSVMAWAD